MKLNSVKPCVYTFSLLLLIGCTEENSSVITPESNPDSGTSTAIAVASMDAISGAVTSSAGSEAGVWVIAETGEFDTFFARIVVTNDDGQYLIPNLPDAEYQVWTRGYGLADSPKLAIRPGQTVNLEAVIAENDAVAAKVYPAAYWYSMMDLPTEDELVNVQGGLNAYLTWMKNMGCIGCHQLGQESTRTIPEALGDFETHEEAWMRRVSSGQAGRGMFAQLAGRLDGIPFKYLGEWTQRIANGELPFVKPKR